MAVEKDSSKTSAFQGGKGSLKGEMNKSQMFLFNIFKSERGGLLKNGMEKSKQVIVVCHIDFKDTAFTEQTLKDVGFKRNTRSRKLLKKLLYTAQKHPNYIFSSGRQGNSSLRV